MKSICNRDDEQVLLSALSSLTVIGGNNLATLPENKPVYAKFVFSCPQINKLTSLCNIFIKNINNNQF